MIFVDTSFLVAFYNQTDINHKPAQKIMHDLAEETSGDVVISDYVFNECATVLFARLKNLQRTVSICEKIKKVKMFKIDEDLFNAAWQIFKTQTSTKFSFTDCTILALMKESHIRDLATFDKDFKQIGWINVRS